MRTGSRIRLRVRKRLCVSVLGGKQSTHFSKFRKYFDIVGIFCIINRYFEYRIRIRCIWLYMGTWFKIVFWQLFKTNPKHVPEVWTIFVLTICLRLFGIWGPKWSPYVAEASLGRGYNIENTKTESRNPHGGAWNPVLWATCLGMPGGARAQYIDRYTYI